MNKINTILSISQETPRFVPFGDDGGMSKPDINIGFSVFKREAQSIQDVVTHLQQNGWSVTSSIGDNRIVYLENSGVNITAVKGPLGTVVIPSGPIRGRMFGEQINLISRGEEEGIVPRGPIRQTMEERREPRGFEGEGLEEFEADRRPGPSHFESGDVIQ